MSDSTSDEEQNNDVHYENCIITRRDDEDSSEGPSSVFSLPCYEADGAFEEATDDMVPANVTIEQITKTQLSKDDTFIFILALLESVERYLNNLDDEVHKHWLKEKTNILKTAIVQNCMAFKVDEVRNINGTLYVKKESPQKKITKKLKKPAVSKKKKTDKNRISGSSLANEQVVLGMDDHPQESVTDSSSRRRSQRLQEFRQDRQVVLCDKLSYISYKLSPARFWRKQAEAKEPEKKNTAKKTRLNKSAGEPGPSREKEKPSHSNKTQAKGVGTQAIGKDKPARKSMPEVKKSNNETPVQKKGKSLGALSETINTKEIKNAQQTKNEGLKSRLRKSGQTLSTPNKKTNRRKVQSLDMGHNINDTVENQTTTSRKRRAASLSRVNKRVKANSTQQLEASTGEGSSNTNGGRRKLYSPDVWLDSLAAMTEDKV